jgi:phosphatidylglycerophosphate synthase
VSLLQRAAAAAAVALVTTTTVAAALRATLRLSDAYPIAAGGTCLVVAALALASLSRHHPFARLGTANLITGTRGVLTALVAAAFMEASSEALAWALVMLAMAAVALDGVDGWVARRQGLASAFGARFDMEVDAFLILALSALVWRFDKAGAWVLASGAMRYAFIAAGVARPWFDRPLPASRRRQAVCVVQIAGLIAALAPIVPYPLSAWVAGVSLAALAWSFWVDVRWLASGYDKRS